MRPTVLSTANANAAAGVGGGGGGVAGNTNSNGINIPIRHDYGNVAGSGGAHPQAAGYYADANAGAYGSPRQQQQQSPQQQPYHHQQQQAPQTAQQQQHPHQQMPQHFQVGTQVYIANNNNKYKYNIWEYVCAYLEVAQNSISFLLFFFLIYLKNFFWWSICMYWCVQSCHCVFRVRPRSRI